MRIVTPPSDPNIRVPAAVAAAAARAEEMHKAVYQSDAGVDPQTEDVNGEEQDRHGSVEAQDAPVVGSTSTEIADTPNSGDVGVDGPHEPVREKSWEHSYKSMKGRYDRAQEDLRGMAERVSTLQRVVDTLEARLAQPATRTAEPLPKLITPEEEEAFGGDFLTVVEKKAKEVFAPVQLEYERQITELKGQLASVGGHIEHAEKNRLLVELDSRVPQWRDMNSDENFLSWLRLPDAYSGVTRQELLDKALERNDIPRVAAFFTGFLDEEAAVAPTGREGRANVKSGSKIPLESLVAPGRAKSAAATAAPAEKPTFTRDQITKFYADSAAGVYRGREAEKERIESQIFEAQREGRIR